MFRRELATTKPKQQETIMEITTSWMKEGIQQGKQQEALTLILRLLKRRLGKVHPRVQKRVEKLSLTQLEQMGEALLEFSNTDDLISWLDQAST